MVGMRMDRRHPGRRRSRRAGIAFVGGRPVPDTAFRPFRDDNDGAYPSGGKGKQ